LIPNYKHCKYSNLPSYILGGLSSLKSWGFIINQFIHVSQSEITDNRHVIKAIYRKNVILVRYCADFFFCFFCIFSAKLVWTITFLSFQIGQLYLVCGCMTIRRCVAYRNDLRRTLTFDLKVK
jgi:hypothetical protein